MKKLLKLFITDFKRRDQFGDMHSYQPDHYFFPFEGKWLMVKVFGLWWRYKYVQIKK